MDKIQIKCKNRIDVISCAGLDDVGELYGNLGPFCRSQCPFASVKS